MIMLAAFIILGGILPFFSPEDPRSLIRTPLTMPPSAEHFLGTTNLSQDTFWLLTYDTQNSLFIGLLVAFFATLIGVFAGLLAGFVGGIPDRIITLLADVFIVVPSLPILILMASLLQGRASLVLISAILILFNWPWPARQVRSIALSMRERQFVNTARFSGSNTVTILIEEVFPHIVNWTMANFVNTVLVAIATESGLAVIGLSSLEEATLGTMIYWALQHQALLGQRWWWIGSPVVAIILLFICLFLISTGISSLSAERRGHQDA